MGKLKRVNFEVIDDLNSEPYEIMNEIREELHEDIAAARIALAWRKALKPDVDGHLVLGKCIKASDLQRELIDYDFVIVLNKEVWMDDRFTRRQKVALIDHELCHADVAVDEEGTKKRDEKGRYVYRIRKHDIEEFQAIVSRHGCYKRDLEQFAEALVRTRREANSLFGKDSTDETTVQIGVENDKGEMEYTEPMKHSEFVAACERIR